MLFLLEANPGPGLGLLLAYTFFGRGMAKASAPGAAIIQFFGGIHEVYFPYVLMKPKMILATIAGGMTGIFLLRALRRRPARAGGPGLDLRGLRADAGRRLPRHHARCVRCGAGVLPGRLGPAEDRPQSRTAT